MISEEAYNIIQQLRGAYYLVDIGHTDRMNVAGDALASASEYIATLEAKAAAAEWRPIESAPKDGRQCLLYYGPGECAAGVYSRSDNWWDTGNERQDPYRAPTHWMPLPATPTTGAAVSAGR